MPAACMETLEVITKCNGRRSVLLHGVSSPLSPLCCSCLCWWSQWASTSWPPAWVCGQGEDKRQWDIMGRGQERCSSPEQSFSEHLQACKIPRQIYTSAAIWQLHVVFNVVSQCNMISCPELQIDRTAHTGNGLNQSAGNWLSKRNSDTSFLPSCISTVKIR